MPRNKSEKELSREKVYEQFAALVGPMMATVYEAMAKKLGGDWFTPIGSQNPATGKEPSGGTKQI